ncbi:MAG: tRNA (adenosine(37)-N6)-dimethylallyltransferase MiaA [Melioribacteraceae bacterium]|nr:tRNA (adenosine(37)-N6)-dimethylallyltransferase MiaA [Melioribacteraceae bacterium]
MENRVIIIAGPTCSGKTILSLKLAKMIGSEIISADSRQVFRHLSIGTAKPSSEELSKIKHHFIDCLNPDEVFNASIFEIESLKIIDELSCNGKIPIVAGGSGLYIKALTDGIFNEPANNEKYSTELREIRESSGNEFLYSELKKVDPVSASKMLPQNWKRVIRALEVFHVTGRPIWELHKEQKREIPYQFIKYAILWDRELLYKNIEERVDKMIEEGLYNEVKSILEMGYGKEINSLNTVGYKEIISCLNGEISFDRAIELIKRNTRRFAKRQMTWFNADKEIKWIKVDLVNDLEEAAYSIEKELHNN